jgi:hypothetical protein
MRDIMSVIAASSLLALGGLGLYVYKSNNSKDDDNDNSDDENEHKNFLRDDDNDAIKLTRYEDDYSEEDVPKLIETKPKRNKSTKSKRRLTGTRRR